MLLTQYERFIAKRYLLPGKGEGFIFLVATISLVAVMLGVALAFDADVELARKRAKQAAALVKPRAAV